MEIPRGIHGSCKQKDIQKVITQIISKEMVDVICLKINERNINETANGDTKKIAQGTPKLSKKFPKKTRGLFLRNFLSNF